MTVPELHEFVPYPDASKRHSCAFCLCALPLCSHERGDKAVHYQTRDRRRPKAGPA